MPLVSVLLPVFNAEKDLPRAMKSLLEQTFSDLEIIAVDDGSTDNSGKLLDSYSKSDSRIRVIHQENARELGKVINTAANIAHGTFLARQDADDASHTDRIANQVDFLQNNKNVGACGTWSWFIDAELGPLYSLELPNNHNRLNNYLLDGKNPFVHGSMMFRADIFQQTGGYRGSYAEDFDLWLRFSEVAKLGMVTSLGYYYWRSINGISIGANGRQQKILELALALHSERTKSGYEKTNWESEFKRITQQTLTESDAEERQTAMHYVRALQLLQFHRYDLAKTEFSKASSGKGLFAGKARRNLAFFQFAPTLSLLYKMLEKREPNKYARRLPAGTKLPPIF